MERRWAFFSSAPSLEHLHLCFWRGCLTFCLVIAREYPVARAPRIALSHKAEGPKGLPHTSSCRVSTSLRTDVQNTLSTTKLASNRTIIIWGEKNTGGFVSIYGLCLFVLVYRPAAAAKSTLMQLWGDRLRPNYGQNNWQGPDEVCIRRCGLLGLENPSATEIWCTQRRLSLGNQYSQKHRPFLPWSRSRASFGRRFCDCKAPQMEIMALNEQSNCDRCDSSPADDTITTSPKCSLLFQGRAFGWSFGKAWLAWANLTFLWMGFHVFLTAMTTILWEGEKVGSSAASEIDGLARNRKESKLETVRILFQKRRSKIASRC